MAQVKPFEWYQHGAPVAIPGMKADSTDDVVDSFLAEEALNPGQAVIRGTNDQQVKAATTATIANVIGIAVHTHKDYSGTGAYYEENYCLPVMTFGDVYVEVAGTVTAGGAVALLENASGDLTFVASTESGATAVTGMTYLASGVEGDIVPVRIRK
jgi:hypothetical protein